jgi:hypothetical protein
MLRPMITAVAKRHGDTDAAPASSTKILKGVGGGSSDGTVTARRPYFW